MPEQTDPFLANELGREEFTKTTLALRFGYWIQQNKAFFCRIYYWQGQATVIWSTVK